MSARADALNDASLELCHAVALLNVTMDALEGREDAQDHLRDALHGICAIVERAKAIVDSPVVRRSAPELVTLAGTSARN